MGFKRTTISVILLTLFAECGLADQYGCDVAPEPCQNAEKVCTPCHYFRFDVAPQYTYSNVRSPSLNGYHGNLWGIQGEFEYKRRNYFYGNASFEWNDGHLQGRGRHRKWIEAVAQGLAGYSFRWSQLGFTAFAGVGYRHVLDHKSFDGFTPAITLTYYQYFIPFGLLTEYYIRSNLKVGLNLKVKPAFDTRMFVQTLSGVYWKIANHLNYEIDLPFTWLLWKKCRYDLDIAVMPFFKFWDLGQCAILSLPRRTQMYFGLQAQLGVRF